MNVVRRAAVVAAVIARSAPPGGVNLLLGDGSVRFVNDGINWDTWLALSTCQHIANELPPSSDY